MQRRRTTVGAFGAAALRRPIVAAALALAVISTGCGESGQADRIEVVRVFAAASLTDAFGQLEQAFESDNPDFDIELNLAGSSSLRAQILAGAPADVFAAANTAVMDDVIGADATLDRSEPFATNGVTIAVPKANPAGVSGLADFADSDLFLGLCAEAVPCGDLARRTLAAAGVDPSIDTNEPDVRALLTKIAVGELDAGIVYSTDGLASDEVDGIAVPVE
ncbi:MAG: molybdate ABC transporter substrate-binding protein, partial [Acidimicrobiales bacterium]